MEKELNIDTWERKEHFNYFKNFEEPYFGVTVKLDCSQAYTHCKQNGISFFLYYLHKSLLAANSVEALRYRIIDDKVIVYDQIHASATIMRGNGTFGFSYMEFSEEFDAFELVAKKEIQRVKSSNGLFPETHAENVIHYTSLPWVDFCSFSHARNFSHRESCPKIAFGKCQQTHGVWEMAVSVHVHHALVDGLHVGDFILKFQDLLNSTESDF